MSRIVAKDSNDAADLLYSLYMTNLLENKPSIFVYPCELANVANTIMSSAHKLHSTKFCTIQRLLSSSTTTCLHTNLSEYNKTAFDLSTHAPIYLSDSKSPDCVLSLQTVYVDTDSLSSGFIYSPTLRSYLEWIIVD